MPALTVLSAFLVRARGAAERGTPRLVAELFCFDKAAVATSGARRPTYGVIVFAGGAIDPLEGGRSHVSALGIRRDRSAVFILGDRARRPWRPPGWCRR
jgi:hypothetical protein